MSRPTVGIAGVGLIGASIGLRAAACGWHVVGWDEKLEHARSARERGAIAQLATSFEALVASVDTLVLAVPLDATLALLATLAAGPPLAAGLVLDVASVKAPVARAGAALGAFVASHPIAGSERSGPLAADAALFEGRTWTYDPAAAPAAVAAVRRFIEAMGGVPFPIASDEHDRAVALTSHLPQLISVALGARLGPELDRPEIRALCGTGVRSMLRLGASSWPIWRAIFAANGRPIAREVRRIASVLATIADDLEGGRPDALADAFATSAAAVVRLAGNTGTPSSVRRATTHHDER
ncbi:MAG: prephenate dehydrogenase [Vulcanimicrobiaceae bacterium]